MAKAHLKRNGLMRGTSKGFSLIELMLFFALIAVLSLGMVPLLRRKGNDIEAFVSQLNSLIEYGRLQAQSAQKTHRVLFDLQKNSVNLEVESPAKNPGSQPDYNPIQSSYLASHFDIPSTIELRRLVIDGKDELSGAKTNKAWFFIAPNGSAQDVVIDVGLAENDIHTSFELTPFRVQFRAME